MTYFVPIHANSKARLIRIIEDWSNSDYFQSPDEALLGRKLLPQLIIFNGVTVVESEIEDIEEVIPDIPDVYETPDFNPVIPPIVEHPFHGGSETITIDVPGEAPIQRFVQTTGALLEGEDGYNELVLPNSLRNIPLIQGDI